MHKTYMIKQLVDAHTIVYLIPDVHEREIVQIAKENDLKHVRQHTKKDEARCRSAEFAAGVKLLFGLSIFTVVFVVSIGFCIFIIVIGSRIIQIHSNQHILPLLFTSQKINTNMPQPKLNMHSHK